MKKQVILPILALILWVAMVSCEKEENEIPAETQHDFPFILDDTIVYEYPFTPTLYPIDLDGDGDIDANLEMVLHANQGGSSCWIFLKVVNDDWEVYFEKKPEYICQDTLHFMGDTSWVYYSNYNCEDNANAYRVDTLRAPVLYPTNDIEDLVLFESTQEDMTLYYRKRMHGSGILPDAVLNDF